MMTIQMVSASNALLFMARHGRDQSILKMKGHTRSIGNALAWITLGLLFALPSSADHERRRNHYPHPPSPHREWTQSRDARDRGVYLELETGVAAMPDAVVHGPFVDGDLELFPGFTTGGAVGARLSPFLRLEGAMSYREAQVDSFYVEGFVSENEGYFGSFSTMANAYIDFAIPGSPVTPFIGGGLGVAVVSLETYDPFEDVHIDDDDVQLAWNVSAGAAWRLSERIDLITRYRYFATENLDEEYQDGTLRFGEADFEMDSHEAVLGVRFSF
jgi:opacity protein-like surface antigen